MIIKNNFIQVGCKSTFATASHKLIFFGILLTTLMYLSIITTHLWRKTALASIKLDTIDVISVNEIPDSTVPPLRCLRVGEINQTGNRTVRVPPVRSRRASFIQYQVTIKSDIILCIMIY